LIGEAAFISLRGIEEEEKNSFPFVQGRNNASTVQRKTNQYFDCSA